MNNAALQQGDVTSYRSAPYDYDTAVGLGTWCEGLVWPVPHRLSFDNAKVALRSIDDPDLQDVALLSLGVVFAASLPTAEASLAVARTKRQGQRRVTYTPISLLGYRQMLPPRLPYLVNLDWQLRFTEILKGLPVERTCRPHPAGLFSSRSNPLAEVTFLSERVFEDLIADADVFVFDYIQSTTIYEALCTDRPVVLIDLGLLIFEGNALAMLAERCRIVPAEFDAGNRPYVDAAKLESAICDGDDFADPSAFRLLLVSGSD